MADDSLSQLPVPLAIRLVLDSVSFSNPLPDWIDTLTIDYAARERNIRRKIKAYLDGEQPKTPFEVMVPKKSGQMARWVIPSINDQIIVQAAVSSMADALDQRAIDKTKVFSCHYNRDPDRIALLENQVAAWKAFQDETAKRCESERCLLQIDIEEASKSVDRARFFGFLQKYSPTQEPIKLLKKLIEALSGDEPGLPLMNDSVFFLGNAFFAEIDGVISRHSPNYIRFVDDYRIFDDSETTLESRLRSISQDLEKLGYRLNSHKLKLGSTEEYLEAVSQLKYATNPVAEYIDVSFGDILQPKEMVAQIVKTLESPEQFLNQGFGRLQLASLRKMHIDMLISEKRRGSPPYSIRYVYADELSQNERAMTRIVELLKTYLSDPNQLWRTLWLLYVIKDLYFYWANEGSGQPPIELDKMLKELRSSQTGPLVVKLWASEIPSFGENQTALNYFEELHDSSYLECGARCTGGQKNG